MVDIAVQALHVGVTAGFIGGILGGGLYAAWYWYWPRCFWCERRARVFRCGDDGRWATFCRRHAAHFDHTARRRERTRRER